MVTSSDATFCAAIAVFSLAALMAANAAAQSGRTTVFLSALLTCVIMCTQAVLEKCKALHKEKSKTVVQNLPATAAVLSDAVTASDATRTIAALSDELATAKAVIAVLQSSNLSDYSEKASQCKLLQKRLFCCTFPFFLLFPFPSSHPRPNPTAVLTLLLNQPKPPPRPRFADQDDFYASRIEDAPGHD